MSRGQIMGVLREGWQAQVEDYAVAGGWAGEGERLLVADAAGTLSAFAGKSGKLAWTVPATHDGGVFALDVAPGGRIFATAGEDGAVGLWDAMTGARACMLKLSDGWVEHLAWSPDGAMVAATAGRHVHAVSAGGELLWTSTEHPSTVSALAWTTGGEVVTACYGEVRFIAAEGGAEREEDRLSWQGSLLSLAISPDGDVVACGSQDNTVHFWRRVSGEDSMMSGYPLKPAVIGFDGQGLLLATNGGQTVTVWSFANGGPEGTSPGVHELHLAPVKALTFAHRGLRLASADSDGAVVVWSLQDDASGEPVGMALASGRVESLYWREDDRALAALDGTGGVQVWRVGQGSS